VDGIGLPFSATAVRPFVAFLCGTAKLRRAADLHYYGTKLAGNSAHWVGEMAGHPRLFLLFLLPNHLPKRPICLPKRCAALHAVCTPKRHTITCA